MEKIQISSVQEQKLLSLFKSRSGIGVPLIILGLSGLIPIGITYFGGSGTNFISSPTFVFFIIGTFFWSQSAEAQKKIKRGEYQAYKAECKKVGWEYASVENNEILSKNVNKAIRKIAILGSRKLIQAGEEIGIIQVGKEFWAFPLIN